MKRKFLYSEEIPAAGSLDIIYVYWHDVGEGQGHVTITCWGCAWTAYFNSTGERTIRQFFEGCEVDYMVDKLASSHLLQGKRRRDYLSKIVTAVRNQIRSEGS